MAQIRYNFWGVVVILEHRDVEAVARASEQAGDVAAVLAGKLPGIPAAILGALSGYLRAQAALVRALDQGNGVYLTMLYAVPGLVIPTPRPLAIGLPPDWVRRGSGRFTTEDGPDLLEYRVERDAVGFDSVEFRLEANDRAMWRRALVIRDGEGGEWDIVIDPSQGVFAAVNGLWAHQVKRGQVFSLWKAKELGLGFWVLDIGDLDELEPGSRVVFTWLKG